MKANNGQALIEVAKRGRGIVLSPDFIARDALESGALVRLFPDWPLTSGGIWALYPHRRYLAARVRRFVDFVRERLGR